MNTDCGLDSEQFRTILQNVADGITVRDAHGRLIYANDMAARLVGYPSAEALLTASIEEVRDRFEVMDEHGMPLPSDRWPGQLALRGDPAPEALVRFRVLSTGSERWSIVRAVPIYDQSGKLQFEVTATQDVTSLKRGEARLRILANASDLLTSSLEYDATLAQVAQLAVPQMADWASVDAIDEAGVIRQVAMMHSDPSKVAWARELLQRYPTDPGAPTGVPAVIRTGRAELYSDISAGLPADRETEGDQLKLYRDAGLRSVLVVPLRARRRILGAITLGEAESGRHYTETDLRVAEELATRAALAVDNARLYRQAQEALHVRDEFLSSLSHDLRTPLTTIRGMTQTLLRRLERIAAPDGETMSDRLGLIDRAVTQMEGMITELLDLSRLEAGRPLYLNPERMDLVQLVQDLVQEYRPVAPLHRLRIETELSRLVGVWDGVRLERVLSNLLSNAIKYSPDGGDVTVSLNTARDGAEHEWVELAIRDEGLGIPSADLPQIFERFHRGRNVAGSIQGIGIGLAGVKQIVEQHQGLLYIQSEEGHGTLVRIRLPLVRSEDQEPASAGRD